MHDNNDIDDNDIVDNLNSSMIDELENCSHIRLVEKGSDYKWEGGVHGNHESGHHQRHNHTERISGTVTKMILTRIEGLREGKLSK